MSLGQSGPPASAKQVQYLKVLLDKAGYPTFADARRPLGLTQRQANGKFTVGEASALIDRLVTGPTEEQAAAEAGAAQLPLTGEEISAVSRLEAERIEIVRGLPAGILAAELERRGWSVTAPD